MPLQEIQFTTSITVWSCVIALYLPTIINHNRLHHLNLKSALVIVKMGPPVISSDMAQLVMMTLCWRGRGVDAHGARLCCTFYNREVSDCQDWSNKPW